MNFKVTAEEPIEVTVIKLKAARRRLAELSDVHAEKSPRISILERYYIFVTRKFLRKIFHIAMTKSHPRHKDNFLSMRNSYISEVEKSAFDSGYGLACDFAFDQIKKYYALLDGIDKD